VIHGVIHGPRHPQSHAVDVMLDLRTYGLKIHYNSTSPGHVGWMNPDTLLYKELEFSMGDFRGFIHGLIGATRRTLREELYLETPAAAPPSPRCRRRQCGTIPHRGPPDGVF
jgi:hypothetical protein